MSENQIPTFKLVLGQYFTTNFNPDSDTDAISASLPLIDVRFPTTYPYPLLPNCLLEFAFGPASEQQSAMEELARPPSSRYAQAISCPSRY